MADMIARNTFLLHTVRHCDDDVVEMNASIDADVRTDTDTWDNTRVDTDPSSLSDTTASSVRDVQTSKLVIAIRILLTLIGAFIAISIFVVAWSLSDYYGFQPLLSGPLRHHESDGNTTVDASALMQNLVSVSEDLSKMHKCNQHFVDAIVPTRSSTSHYKDLHEKHVNHGHKLLGFNESVASLHVNSAKLSSTIAVLIDAYSNNINTVPCAFATAQLGLYEFWSNFIPGFFELSPLALLDREVATSSCQQQRITEDLKRNIWDLTTKIEGHYKHVFPDEREDDCGLQTGTYFENRRFLSPLNHGCLRLSRANSRLQTHYETIRKMIRNGSLVGQSPREHLEDIKDDLQRTKLVVTIAINEDISE